MPPIPLPPSFARRCEAIEVVGVPNSALCTLHMHALLAARVHSCTCSGTRSAMPRSERSGVHGQGSQLYKSANGEVVTDADAPGSNEFNRFREFRPVSRSRPASRSEPCVALCCVEAMYALPYGAWRIQNGPELLSKHTTTLPIGCGIRFTKSSWVHNDGALGKLKIAGLMTQSVKIHN